MRRLKGGANVVTSSSILVTLMMEALSYSETSVLTREDGIFHSRCLDNLKYCICFRLQVRGGSCQI
jgi:hypothetical protein